MAVETRNGRARADLRGWRAAMTLIALWVVASVAAEYCGLVLQYLTWGIASGVVTRITEGATRSLVWWAVDGAASRMAGDALSGQLTRLALGMQAGLLVGVAQWLVLRRYVRPAVGWAAVTAIGWSVGQ